MPGARYRGRGPEQARAHHGPAHRVLERAAHARDERHRAAGRPADDHAPVHGGGGAFVRAKASRPFFLYLAHSMPHVPLFASPGFAGRSRRGLYGDVIEELDWSVGQVLDTLRELKLEDRTLVFFSSDNGPWALFDEQGGSAGPLRGAKGGTFEGGMRVPAIFRWPGTIPPGVVTDLGATLDLLPTIAALTGARARRARARRLRPRAGAARAGAKPASARLLLPGRAALRPASGGAQGALLHPPRVRRGHGSRSRPAARLRPGPGPGERYDIASRHPEVVARIRKIASDHARTSSRSRINSFGRRRATRCGIADTRESSPSSASSGRLHILLRSRHVATQHPPVRQSESRFPRMLNRDANYSSALGVRSHRWMQLEPCCAHPYSKCADFFDRAIHSSPNGVTTFQPCPRSRHASVRLVFRDPGKP